MEIPSTFSPSRAQPKPDERVAAGLNVTVAARPRRPWSLHQLFGSGEGRSRTVWPPDLGGPDLREAVLGSGAGRDPLNQGKGESSLGQATGWDTRLLAASTATSTAHAVLAAIRERHDPPGSAQGGSNELSRCLCPVCSQLEVLNANLETLEAAGPELSTASTSLALSSSLDLSKTFFLHSNPTANHTIYLDFDGHYMASSQWENGGALELRPFYSDFTSSATLLEIQRIWQRIAEDLAPFNVNVTTQEPNTEDLRKSGTGDTRWGIRMAFTYNTNLLTGSAITNAGGGGTAYYNSFNWSTDDIALGFNRGEYAAAETGSHEIGHSLNLRHDGNYDPTTSSSNAYYGGHGSGATSWGAIMGASFIGTAENLTTWSQGEYLNANNTQDDLYTITNGNGFTYRTDDHGNSLANATWLQGVSFSQFGIIERNTDLDWFRFDTGSGTINLSISNASRVFVADGLGGYTTEYLTARGPNLDISASLYRSDGTWIATSNPLDQITASFNNFYLDAGSYYLAIDGVGVGDPYSNPPSGYTDYASLGQYMVTGTVQAVAQPPALVLSQTDNLFTSEGGSTASFSVRLSQAPTADVTVALASSNTAEGTVSPASVTFTTTNWATAQWVTLNGVDDLLVDGPQSYTVSLTASSGDPAFNGLSSPLVSVTNTDDDVAVRTTMSARSGGLQNNLTYTATGAPQVSHSGADALEAVAANDDSRLSISEGTIQVTSGKGRSSKLSTSALDAYVWSFDVVNADRFVFEGYRTANSESDGFRFELSTNGGSTWSSLLTVSSTSGDTAQAATLATPFTGTALVRVVDTNRTAGTSAIDTLYIDRMAFEGLSTDLRPELSVAASTAQAVEDTFTAGVFTVSRSGGSEPLSLTFSLGGTATRGIDYTLVDGNGTAISGDTITLAAGAGSTLVQVVPINDNTKEPAETVIFSLQEPGGNTKLGASSSATVSIVDTLQPLGPFLSTGDSPKSGTVSGSHSLTWEADNQRQVLTEVLSGGSPKNRTSQLEHHWSFDVVTGASEFRINASASGSEGEFFDFSYSTNGISWTSLGSVSGTAAASGVSWDLINGPIDGPVLVRVVDRDRTAGRTSLDSLSIDAMGFFTGPGGLDPILASSSEALSGASTLPWLGAAAAPLA